MDWRARRVLVTGGAGTIGRELINRLLAVKADILCIDRQSQPAGISHDIAYCKADISDMNTGLITEFNPEIIFHLAASFERSKESPEFWRINWRDNILVSHRVIEAAKDASALKAFIFASSYLVYSPELYIYGSLPMKPSFLKEESILAPRNLCGAAKLYTEKEAGFMKEYFRPQLQVVYARIYRVFGCGSKDVISRWVRAALEGKKIEVYNRENRFDFIFAGDVAQGLLKIAENRQAQGAVNLGRGFTHSISEILEILGTSSLLSGKLKIKDSGVLEPFENSCADTARLKKLTGWVPVTSLKKGIKILTDYESVQPEVKADAL